MTKSGSNKTHGGHALGTAFGITMLMIMMLVQGALADDWPMFMHDANHTGTSMENVMPPLSVLWRYPTGVISSSLAVSGGMVYVGSSDGNVYALDATTGNLKWKYPVSTFSPYAVTGPAVSGGVVYVGSTNGKVYAINATNGALIWSNATNPMSGGGSTLTSPTVSGGMVYVGSLDANVYALDAATGASKWKYQTGDVIEGPPAVSDGVVYVDSEDWNVYALDAATGTLKWSYKTGSFIDSSPTVSGGVVYVGSTNGKVYALDATTSVQKWNSTTNYGSYLSSPAVSGGVVYVASPDDAKVYAFDAATGALKWSSAPIALGSVSSPAVSGGIVYVGSYNGMYALDATTGNLKWRYITNIVRSWPPVSPGVSGGAVYVGSNDGNVYAFATATPTPTPPVNGTNLTNITVLTQTVVAGTNATYVLNLTNTGTLTDKYTLTISNPKNALVGLNISSPVTISAGASKIFQLNVTNTSAGAFHVNVTAISTNDPTKLSFINTTTTVTKLSVNSSTGQGTVYFETDAGTIENLTALNVSDIPTPPPVGATFPYGLFSFNITGLPLGGSANLTMTFSGPAPSTYYKYGQTHADPTPHWYTIPVTINGNSLTIMLTDGGTGDDDLVANGVIEDPGGPSFPPVEAAIRFNISSKDIEVYNETGSRASYIVLPTKKVDDGKEEQDKYGETSWELRQYTLKDLASNSLVLVLKHKKEGKEAEVKVVSMQYNGGSILMAPENKMQAEYSEEKNSLLNELEQKIEVKKQFDAEAKYNAEKDETELKVKIEGQKEQKETRAGIAILGLLTDRGGLKLRY